MQERLSIVLPTFNERENIRPLLQSLLSLDQSDELEVLIVDDDSTDGTHSLVKNFAQRDSRIRLIRRVGRAGLASAIKEGLLNATGDFAVVMDADGQHRPEDVLKAVRKLKDENLDLVAGSRFLDQAKIRGLSQRRTGGSSFANRLAGLSLPGAYSHLTDYMSGCLAIDLKACLPFIYNVDVNGFKFFYELLSVSQGQLNVEEVALTFQPRLYGKSKLDLSILWDFLISFLHTSTFRLLPRRAISFAIVGTTGVAIQLVSTQLLLQAFQFNFEEALPISVLLAATSNYLINNSLTFRDKRLGGLSLLRGLLKFLLVASLPVMANIGLATAFYNVIARDTLLAQMAGIFVVFIWNYVASSRFVWHTH
ncbi:glycosyltransferase family 2 protein [Prochlorococcus sp. MIT 1307]|uniref:glycosyltransferase family 2 protein n=1 Tax=Prochlorococcus sp. MIT 1307 TaxID=3096219 RepID=UPI002A755797|nr:glycosyltransferase family 2 protein [Prochlorococcus sp. MIT 1307]